MSSASSESACAQRVLPMPGSPRSITACPCPDSARSNAVRRAPSSWARPTSCDLEFEDDTSVSFAGLGHAAPGLHATGTARQAMKFLAYHPSERVRILGWVLLQGGVRGSGGPSTSRATRRHRLRPRRVRTAQSASALETERETAPRRCNRTYLPAGACRFITTLRGTTLGRGIRTAECRKVAEGCRTECHRARQRASRSPSPPSPVAVARTESHSKCILKDEGNNRDRTLQLVARESAVGPQLLLVSAPRRLLI